VEYVTNTQKVPDTSARAIHMQYKFGTKVAQWEILSNLLNNICHSGSIYKWWQWVRAKFDKSQRKLIDEIVISYW